MIDSTNNQLIPLPVITPETVQALSAFLQKRRDVAVGELSEIKSIANDEEAAEVEATLATAKQLYDQMAAKRKAFTDPIKEAITVIMSYENEINYTSKTDNQYNRARKVLEDYNQSKVDAANIEKANAKLKADTIKYKAEYKAKVQEQLQDMLSGKHRTVLHGMAEWEKSLTLENLDAKVTAVKNQQPTLKQPDYDGCFRRLGLYPALMNPAHEDAYLAELKMELSYEVYNNKFQEIVAPIKNEYLAKVPAIKANLEAMAKAGAEEKARLEKAAEAKREEEKAESLRKAAAADELAKQDIKDTKDMGIMEGDFTQQAMTADIDAGPSKKVFYFESDAMWLPPFLQVVSKCATHPKFKGIMAKDGYVPEVDKWLKFYSANVGEAMKGLKSDEVAKTIVKKK